MAPPINHLAEHGFGGAGAALMNAMAQHRAAQEHAASYQHPPSLPPAHPVGRPGETALQGLEGGVFAGRRGARVAPGMAAGGARGGIEGVLRAETGRAVREAAPAYTGPSRYYNRASGLMETPQAMREYRRPSPYVPPPQPQAMPPWMRQMRLY